MKWREKDFSNRELFSVRKTVHGNVLLAFPPDKN